MAGEAGVEFRPWRPAVHDTGAAAGRKIEEDSAINDLDVTQEVLEPVASIVFEPVETGTHQGRSRRGLRDIGP